MFMGEELIRKRQEAMSLGNDVNFGELINFTRANTGKFESTKQNIVFDLETKRYWKKSVSIFPNYENDPFVYQYFYFLSHLFHDIKVICSLQFLEKQSFST